MLKEKKINNLIAAVRGIAIALVVFGHAIIPAIREENKDLLYLWNGIYSFHMFLYFFISGYLFQKGIKKYSENKKLFILKKFKLLIIPYITLTLIEYGLLLIGCFDWGAKILTSVGLPSGNILNFLKALFFNSGHYDTHLWFIYALFFIFIINICIPQISNGILYFVILIICSGLYPVLGETVIPIRTILYWSVPFWIGRQWFSRELLSKIITYKNRLAVVFCILFVTLNGLLNSLDCLSDKLPIVISYIRIGASYEIKHFTGIIGVIIVFWLVNQINNKKILNCLLILDKYSYDIYIIHQPFLTVGLVTVLLIIGINIYVTVALSTIFAIVVSIIISKYFIRKNKILNIALLGNHNKG